MSRCIFHIDCNSAFLSFQAAYNLSVGHKLDLRKIPAVVGGSQADRRGVVLAKSIPCKNYGIKTGEPLAKAKEKCPGLVIVPPNYPLYMKCHKALMDILREYSPLVQSFSIDEAFLDYTGMEEHFGPCLKGATLIKNRIREELGFTVNIGISTNKLLAKMASDFTKPDRVHTLFPQEIPSKLWPLPVERLFMVGRATKAKLNELGIFTIGDLANYNRELLGWKLKSHGLLIHDYANGIENSPVLPNDNIQMKGMGNSTTIKFDVDNKKDAHKVLLSLAETVAARLRNEGYKCGVVSVSIKTHEFLRYSHQRKLAAPTDNTNELYEIATQLFDEAWNGEPICHLGIHVSHLYPREFTQYTLFDNVKKGAMLSSLDRAVDNIRKKYGGHSIFRATYLYSGMSPMAGGVGTEDYAVMGNIL
ncbi:MAG TPA: DNA polymerase IV [Clostridiales bacterium]|nr:DNA polymerase IV [Clostridiales bacterium]